MKKVLSAVLLLLMLLQLLPLSVLAQEVPSTFGWLGDNNDFSAWTIENGCNLTVTNAVSGTRCVRQSLLTDPDNFCLQLTITIHRGRAYINVLGVQMEFGLSEDGNSLYNNQVDWFAAASGRCRVNLQRINGGALQLTILGSGLPITRELAVQQETGLVTLGVYETDASASYNDLLVQNGFTSAWEARSGIWTAKKDGVYTDNNAGLGAVSYTAEHFNGSFRIDLDLEFTKFYMENRIGSVRIGLGAGVGQEVSVLFDIMAENNGKVTVGLSYVGAETWELAGQVGWNDADAGKFDGKYHLTVERPAGSKALSFTLTRGDGITVVGGQSMTIEKLSDERIDRLHTLLTEVYNCELHLNNLQITDTPDGAALEGWSGSGDAFATLGDTALLALGDNTQTAYKLFHLTQTDSYTASVTMTFGSDAENRELILADCLNNEILTVRVEKGSNGIAQLLLYRKGKQLNLFEPACTDAGWNNTTRTLTVTRLQGKNSLLVSCGSAGLQVELAEGANAAAIGLRSDTMTTFSGIRLTANALCEESAPSDKPFSWESGDWHSGVTASGERWAACTLGGTIAAYTAQRLYGETWRFNSGVCFDKDGEATVYLLDVYCHPVAAVTLESGSTGTTCSVAVLNDETLGWDDEGSKLPLSAQATQWNVSLAKKEGQLVIDVSGNDGSVMVRTIDDCGAWLDAAAYGGVGANSAVRFGNAFAVNEAAAVDEDEAKIAYENLMKNYLDPVNNRLYPVEGGYLNGTVTNTGKTVSVARAGELWESSVLLMTMDTYAQSLPKESEEYRQVAQQIANTVNNFLDSYSFAELTTAGTAPVNHAVDDCSWNIAALLLGYRYHMALGNQSHAEACLAAAKALFDSVYDTFYDEKLGGGIWYNRSKTDKTLYAAMTAIDAWDLAQLTGDAEISARAQEIYDGIENNLRRSDGLYWCDIVYSGYAGIDNPYGIQEAGSVSFIGCNMAMAVLNARMGKADAARQTASAICRWESCANGAYLNDRDAWDNAYFVGMWTRELLDTGLLGESYRQILAQTAQVILQNAVFPDGYYSAAWNGPQEPSAAGYPLDYTGTRNNWGRGSSGGSTPKQMMTSATTANMVIAAAVMETNHNAALAELSLGESSLWPVFNGNVTEYTVLNPPQGHELTLSFTADNGASVCVNGEILSSGDMLRLSPEGVTQLVVTAADGKTQQVYTLRYPVYCLHEQTELQGVLAPDCTHAGYSGNEVCKLCQTLLESGTELQALGHDIVNVAAVAATCTATGLTEGSHCSRCDYKVAQTEIDALGHAWGKGTVTVEPAADKKGVMTYSCSRCDVTRTEEIPEAKLPFTDVSEGKWYEAAVRFAYANKLIVGTSETNFSPDGSMTRAMLVAVLWRLDGETSVEEESTFTDVPAGQWYTQAVSWAAQKNIVAGIGNGKFNPAGEVTREQIAAVMLRYAQFKGYDTDKTTGLSSFPDNGKVSKWAEEALAWAAAEGLISGISTGGTVCLAPQGNATRSQVAAILLRYVSNVVNAG